MPSPALRTPEQLRDDALAIWRAGVAAVDSARLVRENLRVEGGAIHVGPDDEIEPLPLANIGRLVIVGAGKAGAGMAAGAEEALGEGVLRQKNVAGWLNVPADCVRPLKAIRLHAGRPAGLNEPTTKGARGSEEILKLVRSLRPNDLCLCLISGGGSALLPAPVAAISLADKQAVTRFLSASGANIGELNAVRKQLSRIKGGGLARACSAGTLISLIISDVPGDPLDLIASGPTVPDSSTPADALAILNRYEARAAGIAPAALAYLERAVREHVTTSSTMPASGPTRLVNLVIGHNATAVDAAGIEAERRGYSHAMTSSRTMEPTAEEVGEHLATLALRMRREPGPDCLITGGEPVVKLAPAAERGKGGRNQQLVLAALARLQESAGSDAAARRRALEGIALVSGGTDGEDGPTDAAGALIDSAIASAAVDRGLDPHAFLRRNDAYNFFDPLGALLRTGPTHTNVCDLRVVTVDRRQ